MLKENMYLGMKVARRDCEWTNLPNNHSEEDKNAKFNRKPLYIVRWLERPNDELNRVADPKEYCVINEKDLTKHNNDYREGNYAHADILEPYDLAMKKQNMKGGK